MAKLVYDVAVSLDGFISDREGGVEGFLQKGDHVDDYLARLASYKAAIMGRATYEFGYRWGLKPGDNPYPNMETHVVSETLNLPDTAAVTVIRNDIAESVRGLKEVVEGEVYLAGGGRLAGYLLRERLIDHLLLKVNPVATAGGVSLFGDTQPISMRLVEARRYKSGVVLLSYSL